MVTVGEFALGQPSLDEVFLALTRQPHHQPRPSRRRVYAAAGPPGRTRPEPPGAWAASAAFGWRALLKIMSARA